MKLLISISIVFATSMSYGQATAKYFAQCLFEIDDHTEMVAFNEEMRTNPNIEMVRLDHNTQRALIITHGLTDLTEADLRSWFGPYGETIHCIQIGVFGVDVMDRYPFTNCQ